MYVEESTTKAIRRKYLEAGFDPNKDLFPNYTLIEGTAPPSSARWTVAAPGAVLSLTGI